MYGVNRVVLGENKTFVGGEDLLRSKGVEVINLENEECYALMQKFITERPQDWNEDIGV
jgi:cytosine deaminase